MPDIWLDVDAAVVVPVNILPLTDDTDFKTREVSLAYNASGMDLTWNFVTSAGAVTQTAVTPTTSGDYDWTHLGDGIYTIEIPASGGASINNNAEGYGWFTGFITGVLPWRGPTIGFRAAGLNDVLCDSAYSTTRGLAGTALPNAAADAAGGLPISDAGGLDLDGLNTNVSAVLTDTGTTLPGTLTTIEGKIDTVDGVADDILVDTGTTIPAQISALNNLSSADVNAQVVDALSVDTYAEPGQGTPSATLSLAAKINYMFKAWRNRSTVTTSEYALFADDGTTKDQKATLSDNGTTFDRGEVTTGA